MIRTINDLDYLVHSPSTYELLSVSRRREDDQQAAIYVYFTGFGWAIKYASPGRGDIIRPFPSREAAFRLISDRRTMDCA